MQVRAHQLLVGAASVALVAAATGPRSVAGGVSFSRCGRPAPIGCPTVEVPLDRLDAGLGTIRLAIEKIPAREKRRGAIVALAGGPGESSTEFTPRFARWLSSGLADRDLIVVDLRGTGKSQYLSCPTLDERCADLPGIHDYTTRDAADDIEAVRQALGLPRIALYGVSYGTKVAETYAVRYPQRVELLVLDSVVKPDGWDF